MLGYNRWPRGRRMGVLTASGGSCDIIADAASTEGLQIPDFALPTAAAITQHLPPFASARNPLDVTGFGLANVSARTGTMTAIDHALDAAVDDPNLDFVLFNGVNLPDTRPPDEVMAATLEARLDWLARRMASAPIPVIPIGATCVDVSAYGREMLSQRGLTMLGGLNTGIKAVSNALRWLENRGGTRHGHPGHPGRPGRPPARCPRPPPSWSPVPGRRPRRGNCSRRPACRWCPERWQHPRMRPWPSPGGSGCRQR